MIETLDELAAIFWNKRRWTITEQDLEQSGQTVATPLPLNETDAS